MRIAVLGSSDSWYFRDLRRAARAVHEMVSLPFSSLTSAVQDDACDVSSERNSLREFDAILVRTMPPGSLEQVVFRMDALAQLEASGTVVVNPPRAIEVAVDKYLATARLQATGLTVPATFACQTIDEAMTAFEHLGGDVVVKPLFGGEGRGITRVSDEAIALRAFKALAQIGAVIYLQRFISHDGCDLRLFVLGRQVWGMRRCNPDDWRTNISRGAVAEPWEVDDNLRQTALRAADCVGASIAGVDVLPGHDGVHYVLEVNAVPGWKALVRTLDVDVGAAVVDHVVRLVEERN